MPTSLPLLPHRAPTLSAPIGMTFEEGGFRQVWSRAQLKDRARLRFGTVGVVITVCARAVGDNQLVSEDWG